MNFVGRDSVFCVEFHQTSSFRDITALSPFKQQSIKDKKRYEYVGLSESDYRSAVLVKLHRLFKILKILFAG